jgi:hypothetical protein
MPRECKEGGDRSALEGVLSSVGQKPVCVQAKRHAEEDINNS